MLRPVCQSRAFGWQTGGFDRKNGVCYTLYYRKNIINVSHNRRYHETTPSKLYNSHHCPSVSHIPLPKLLPYCFLSGARDLHVAGRDKHHHHPLRSRLPPYGLQTAAYRQKKIWEYPAGGFMETTHFSMEWLSEDTFRLFLPEYNEDYTIRIP